MKKIITLFILLAVFTVSCGKKVKVDESQCLNPDELNQMLGDITAVQEVLLEILTHLM